ncbi:MotE family protein [Halobacteriovorax sp.]|uniref:MotE family protein n=1 Tax=Halobacteriovorax sp. TaxID=2020862 RepID=UPI003569E7C3
MKSICGLLIFILVSNVFAQDTKVESDKLVFTKDEFRKAVMDEMEKRMRKIGRSKMTDFSNQLLKKEEELERRELELQKENQSLKINEKSFVKRVKLFNERQEKFISCLDSVDTKESKRIDHMVDVVSGMRPQNAADVLSVQDSVLSVQILGKLDATKVSKIFNLMDKEVSARLQKQYLTMKR